MKVSYVYGVCVKNDAISNAIRDEITALIANGIDDVRLYAYECEHEQLPFYRVNNVTDIALDTHFQSSDLVVFHFGIYYPLFNLLAIVPRRAKRLVVFHNITPKEFLPAVNQEVIDKSFAQMANIIWADHVICDSETNLSVLRSWGIQTPASVLPLAVQMNATPPSEKPSFSDEIIRIAFVGRFVRSKGPIHLLTALESMIKTMAEEKLQLDMVGNLVFSDQVILDKVQQVRQALEQKFGERLQIRVHGDADDSIKQKLLREADLFVLPTYHEGFCVPIAEAIASGCKVIAYENSNTPAICGGLATLIPTGDVDQLTLAMKKSVDRLRSAKWQGDGTCSYMEYATLALKHVEQFSPQRVGQRFGHFIRNWMGW